jgi:hypothetical protein
LRRRALLVNAFALHGIRRRVGDDTAQAQHMLTAGGVAVCGLGRVGPLELGGCGKAEVGGLRSRGVRGIGLASRTTLWSALTFGALVRWSFAKRVGLSLAVDGVVPLLQRHFAIGDADVGRNGPVGVRLLAGIGVRFG